MTVADDRLVIELADCGPDTFALVGGKGANLGELIRAGAPVPDGFVVTTEAYEQMVQGSRHRSGDGDPSDALRQLLLGAELPTALERAVRAAYDRLGGTVAVRSSATAEDLPGAAFAGQQDTVLGVTGADAVLDAVRRCWASLWNERAIAYRDRLGLDDDQVRIAVVVQRLVESDVAGVMFTADPVSGSRDRYVIDASPGLGEAVVSGRVTPDHYVTDPDGRIRDWTAGRREVVIRSTGTGTVETTAPADAEEPAPAPVLPAEVIAELCRHATVVAEHFGRPQDIEWAWADDRVHLVQARPMTALPSPPQTLNPIQRQLSGVLLDYITHRPYPIDMSTWVPYGPIGMMAQVADDIGVRGVFSGILHESDGVVDHAVIPRPRPSLRLLGAPLRALRRIRRYDTAHWREDPRWQGMEPLVGHLDRVDVTALVWDELVRMPARAMAAIRPLTGLRIDYLPAAGFALLRLLVLTRLLGRPRAAEDLLHGAPTETTAMNRALADLAAITSDDPHLRTAIGSDDLTTARAHPRFGPALDAWLDRFGHRETETLVLITQPTLAEEPRTVLRLVKVLLAEPAAPDGAADAAARLADLLAHPLLRTERVRSAVTRAVTAARNGVAFREDTHVAATLPMPALRRSLAELGRRLADAGVLDTAEDIVHCRLEEVQALPDPAADPGAGEQLRQRVAARRARREELAGVPLINIAPPRTASGADALLVGAPASSGTAAGPVRVIRGASEFGQLQSGDVLVCPYTNPSWTPLFQRAAAVVVDSGGPASHAAIVAREYGIPAVMGTRTGTSVLADGGRVLVDGSAGVVRAAEDDGDDRR